MQRRALITIDGTVGDAGRAPFVDAHLTAAGDDERLPVQHRGELVVVTEDGRRVEVALPDEVVVRPSRTVSGSWRELWAHPARPEGDYHADGHVKLKGVWLLPGEPIRVIGAATSHDFVDDTGGPREAPHQAVRALTAVAIGAGDDSRDEADRAFRQAERRRRPRRLASSRGIALAGVLVFAVAAVALIAAEVAWRRGTLGAGVSAVWLAALWSWWAGPHAPFPGGATNNTNDDDFDPFVHAALGMFLVLPFLVVAPLVADAPARRDAGACAPVAMMGVWVVWSAWKGVLQRPRAVPGPQVMLPRRRVHRWVVLGLLLAAFIAALVLVVPQMESNDPS